MNKLMFLFFFIPILGSDNTLRRATYNLPPIPPRALLTLQEQRTSPLLYRVEREITISIPGESAGVMHVRKMLFVVNLHLNTAQKEAELHLLVTHRRKTVTEHRAKFNW